MRPDAHITTIKYRRNRVFEANPRHLAKSTPKYPEINAFALIVYAALAYDVRTGFQFRQLRTRPRTETVWFGLFLGRQSNEPT